MTITERVNKAHGNAVAKGFYDDTVRSLVVIKNVAPELFETVRSAFIAQRLMLITSELGEALEAMRLDKGVVNEIDAAELDLLDGQEFIDRFLVISKDSFGDELADAMIRIFDLAGFSDLPLEKHLEWKSKYNATRTRLHGGKKF
jgi:NTP pyrophosphatase (non-canonical NTP hydrolase)